MQNLFYGAQSIFIFLISFSHLQVFFPTLNNFHYYFQNQNLIPAAVAILANIPPAASRLLGLSISTTLPWSSTTTMWYPMMVFNLWAMVSTVQSEKADCIVD